jgi:hypothetical protein
MENFDFLHSKLIMWNSLMLGFFVEDEKYCKVRKGAIKKHMHTRDCVN